MLAGFFTGSTGIPPCDLLVPGWMERPRPSFADRTPGHGLESTGFPERTKVDVDEDSAQHDEGRNIVQDVADGHRNSTERPGADPKDNPGDQVDDAAHDDLPELHLLAGVEEAGVDRFKFLSAGDVVPDVAHPAAVRLGPLHRLEPVQHLEPKEKHEPHAEPGMHGSSQRSPAENRSEPTKQPGQVDAESGKQGEEEKQCHHPMQEAGVDRMPELLALIHFGVSERVEGSASFVVETLNRGSHSLPPSSAVPVAACAGLR